MEYDEFYQFLYSRPLNELINCQQRINEIIVNRQLEGINEQASTAISQLKTEIEEAEDAENVRIEAIMNNVIDMGLLLPRGMNAFHSQLRRFIRWLPGYDKPAPIKTAIECKLSSDWFIHKEFQVYMHWSVEGFYEMSSKDTRKFNVNHKENHHLLTDEEREMEKAHSEKRKLVDNFGPESFAKQSKHEKAVKPTVIIPSEKNSPSSSTQLTDPAAQSNQKAEGDAIDAKKPPTVLPPLFSVATILPDKAPQRPPDGSSVYVTQGALKGAVGKVLGTHWASPSMLRVQFAKLAGDINKVVNMSADHVSRILSAEAMSEEKRDVKRESAPATGTVEGSMQSADDDGESDSDVQQYLDKLKAAASTAAAAAIFAQNTSTAAEVSPTAPLRPSSSASTAESTAADTATTVLPEAPVKEEPTTSFAAATSPPIVATASAGPAVPLSASASTSAPAPASVLTSDRMFPNGIFGVPKGAPKQYVWQPGTVQPRANRPGPQQQQRPQMLPPMSMPMPMPSYFPVPYMPPQDPYLMPGAPPPPQMSLPTPPPWSFPPEQPFMMPPLPFQQGEYPVEAPKMFTPAPPVLPLPQPLMEAPMGASVPTMVRIIQGPYIGEVGELLEKQPVLGKTLKVRIRNRWANNTKIVDVLPCSLAKPIQAPAESHMQPLPPTAFPQQHASQAVSVGFAQAAEEYIQRAPSWEKFSTGPPAFKEHSPSREQLPGPSASEGPSPSTIPAKSSIRDRSGDNGRERDRGRDKESERDTERDLERGKDREKDRERGQTRERDREKDRERERDRDWSKDRGGYDRDEDRGSSRREKVWNGDKDGESRSRRDEGRDSSAHREERINKDDRDVSYGRHRGRSGYTPKRRSSSRSRSRSQSPSPTIRRGSNSSSRSDSHAASSLRSPKVPASRAPSPPPPAPHFLPPSPPLPLPRQPSPPPMQKQSQRYFDALPQQPVPWTSAQRTTGSGPPSPPPPPSPPSPATSATAALAHSRNHASHFNHIPDPQGTEYERRDTAKTVPPADATPSSSPPNFQIGDLVTILRGQHRGFMAAVLQPAAGEDGNISVMVNDGQNSLVQVPLAFLAPMQE